jgi:acyl-CoA thioester hydrolase
MADTKFTGNDFNYFSPDFAVRDYECDIQGVVNNANYLHYLEHARHQFLISREISFSQLHDEGIDLIVTRVEIDYKYPLRSLDKFKIGINVRREGNVRLVFDQRILRIPDQKIIADAKVTGVATRNGRPVAPGKLIEQMGLK